MGHALVRKQSVDQILLQGLAFHRAENWTKAQECYAAVLARNPKHADTLNLAGVLARQRGELDGALRLIRQAIAQKPLVGMYHQNLGWTLHLAGQPEKAVASLRTARRLDPQDGETPRLLGEALEKAGRLAEAEELYQAMVEEQPKHVEAYARLSTLRMTRGDTDGAVALLQRAVERCPESWELHFGLGGACLERKQLDQSLAAYERTIQLKPDYAEAHNCKGRVLHQLRDVEGARASYLRTLELDAEHAGAMSNLGALLMEAGDLDTAAGLFRCALRLQPDLLSAQSNLGTVLTKLGDLQGAVQSFRQVLLRDPRHVASLCSLGFLHDSLGDEEGAQAFFRLALEYEPDSPVALFNLSQGWLAQGEFARGWRAYDERWQVRQFSTKRRVFAEPQWRGEDVAGKRILVDSEQGFGDTLQFVRYVKLLAARGAEVILEVQPALKRLLRNVAGAAHVIASGESLPGAFNLQCPLMSLPGAFGTELNTIPAETPYVAAEPQAAQQWGERLRGDGLRVGLVWSGNPKHTRDKLRSIPLKMLEDVLRTPGVTFYSLQKGPGVAELEQIATDWWPESLEAELQDFADTAAVIENLDLVICVDTAVAHLAGAMGKPVWILLAAASDWRWLKDRRDCPWYPTAKLFRQSRLGEWHAVLQQLKEELVEMAGAWREDERVA